MSYRGRFAPTPSGPLHLGSLLTALASFLQARSQRGQWLIRMDDLDELRCVPGADTQILHQLEVHGLLWDELPRYQTAHQAGYREALQTLKDRNLLYACECTRAILNAGSLIGPDGAVYAGTCRNLGRPLKDGLALRIRLTPETSEFIDGWQGYQSRALTRDIGDFTVRRSDGRVSYQLACAVDEAAQGITEVVRGSDLLGSTFRQCHLQKMLALPQAHYRHLPLLMDAGGNKLSKQNHAAPARAAEAPANLLQCLHLLNQQPPSDLANAQIHEIIDWAIPHWQPQQVPQKMSLTVE